MITSCADNSSTTTSSFAFDCTVVALTVADWIVLVTLKLVRPLILVRFAFVALSVPAWIVPLAVRLFSPVRFVIVAFVDDKVPAWIYSRVFDREYFVEIK